MEHYITTLFQRVKTTLHRVMLVDSDDYARGSRDALSVFQEELDATTIFNERLRNQVTEERLAEALEKIKNQGIHLANVTRSPNPNRAAEKTELLNIIKAKLTQPGITDQQRLKELRHLMKLKTK